MWPNEYKFSYKTDDPRWDCKASKCVIWYTLEINIDFFGVFKMPFKECVLGKYLLSSINQALSDLVLCVVENLNLTAGNH